jgi:hypothetical protein
MYILQLRHCVVTMMKTMSPAMRCSSVVECLPTMQWGSGSIPSSEKKKEREREITRFFLSRSWRWEPEGQTNKQTKKLYS